MPDLEHDAFWEDSIPEPLYTPASANRPHNPMVGSCNDMYLKKFLKNIKAKILEQLKKMPY